MSRLIDADTLIHAHKSEVATIGKDWTVDALATAIETAPTIDAIPVAWLEKRWSETLPDGIEPDFDINYAFQEVMSEWHQEQEAKDG